MNSQSRAWAAFGAFALDGYLPREKPIKQIEARIAELRETSAERDPVLSCELETLLTEWERRTRKLYSSLEPWETVVVARHALRPLTTDYIRLMVDDFCEVHGDGVSGDDPAIITGLGRIGPHRVMIVGHNRGRTPAERAACRFGCARPEGYRKALAKMRLAAKFSIPIVTLIDTPGAYPGVESEEGGIARAIANNLSVMPRLAVPIVSVVIGEGGSGGALGIGVADRLAMLEHSIYSVISPEGCAAILWKASTHAHEAASALSLRAADLQRLRLVDAVLPEPAGGAHRNHVETAARLQAWLEQMLAELAAAPVDTLLGRRHERLRNMGRFFESASSDAGRRAAESVDEAQKELPIGNRRRSNIDL